MVFRRSLVISSVIREPFDNGSLKDFTNFSVWNFQRIDTVCLRGGKLYVIGSGQITGQVKNTPQIIFGRMEIIISKIFIDVLKNVFTGEQFFKLEDLSANLGGNSSHPMDSRRQNLRNGTRRTSILPVKHVFLHVLF